jgi:hypothetical protein
VAAALGPPAVAFAVMWVSFAVRVGLGIDTMLHPTPWIHWDAGFYLDIARRGYTAQWHCSGHSLPPHTPPGNYLGGSIQWFPGYPAAIRGVTELTAASLGASALGVSWLCWYAFLAVGWRLTAGAVSTPARWVCLALLAAAPPARSTSPRCSRSP